MSKYQRTKGHNFERQVAADLREFFPDAKRSQQATGGFGAPDVEIPHYHIECKVGARPLIMAALRQAIDDSTKTQKIPVAVCKFDRDETIVAMRYSDWREILAQLHGGDVNDR